MAYVYPLDFEDLVARIKQRGADFAEHVGVEEGMREDLVLTAVAWGLSTAWFPVNLEGQWHGRIDIGLPDLSGDSLLGANVRSIGDGEVVFIDSSVLSDLGFDLGRVIVRYQTPSGDDFFVQYYHLDQIHVLPFQQVSTGDVIGTVGWHGDFPHLSFGAASRSRIGEDDDLVPEYSLNALPRGDAASNTLRVSVDALDTLEWPIEGLGGQAGYVFNPIEIVRFCRGEPYMHDVGLGSRHGVKPVEGGEQKRVSPDTKVEIEVLPLQSAPLKANRKLVALAHDPSFEPIAKGESDAEVVKAIQQALKLCQYDLGRFGPDNDGIDGDFGATTERILKRFQDVQLRQMLKEAGDKGILGLKEADLRTDGKLDWLTLMGLDMVATAHAAAPPPPRPEPTKAPPPPRPSAPTPALAPSGGDWVFDGLNKKPSLRLGMKMYKALLGWESDGTKGVGYSTCNSKHYGKVIPAGLSPEWPETGLTPDGTKKVEDKSYSLYSCFRVTWVGSNFTNCCNSQMAALAHALGGGKFGVKKPDGTIVTYDIRAPKDKKQEVLIKVKAKKGGPAVSRSALAVFEQTWVNGMLFYDESDNPIYGESYGGMMYAIRFLGIGDALFKFTTSQDELKKMRLGDLASYSGHAWLVGDVRYRISFQGLGDKDDCVLDQSSFIDGVSGTLITIGKGKKTHTIDGRRAVNAADCDWIIANEQEFERRVSTFLGASKLVRPDGVEHEVKKIEVAHWRVFSANGNKSTAHSKQYDADGDGFKLNEKRTAAQAKINGITRPWCDKVKPVTIGRLYGPAS